MTSAASRVWLSWTAGNPEPAGLKVVRDASNVVSYTDSPEWRTWPGEAVWTGYKRGEKVTRDWARLLAEFGPVTGVVEEKPRSKPEAPGKPPVAPWPHFGGVTA